MTPRVLVAYDGSEKAEAAVEYVVDSHPDDDITLLMVLDPMDGFLDAFGHGTGQYEGWRADAEAEAKQILQTAKERFPGEADVTIDTTIGQVSQAIVRYAVEHEFDHIVIGSHGRSGMTRILLGSVAEQVVRRAPIPVTVVR